MWNPFKRKQWDSKQPDTKQQAQEDAKEDLELGDEQVDDVAGGKEKEKWS